MTPVMRTLKRHFPESSIDLFIPHGSKDLFDHHPSLENGTIHTLKKGSGLQRFKQYYALMKTPYDLILNLSESSKGHLISLFHPSAIKIALHPGRKPSMIYKIYKHLVRHGLNTRHQVERDLDALRCMQMEILEEDKELQLGLNPQSLDSLLAKLPMHLHTRGSYVIMQPTSRKEFKELPVKTIANVAIELKRRGFSLVLSAGKSPHELHYIAELQTLAKDAFDVVFAGELSLQELFQLIERSKGMITVDSLGVHLASSFKIPHLALFGPTADLRWGPWKNPRAAIYSLPMACRPCLLEGCGSSGVSDCLLQMKAEKVVEAFLALQVLEFSVQ